MEKAMLRARYDVKLMDRKNTKDLMDMLGLTASIGNDGKWFGHVLKGKRK